MSDYFHHEPIACRVCGYVSDEMSNPLHPGAAPRPGRSFTLCMRCAEVSVWDVGPLGNLIMREPSTEELVEFSRHPEGKLMATAVQAVIVERARRERGH